MESNPLVVFNLDSQRYALPLTTVEKVVRMVEITPLPKAPKIVAGVVNFRGDLIPVVNIRKRFGLPERETDVSDVLIFARTARRRLAVVADTASEVIHVSEKHLIDTERIGPGIEYVAGVVKLAAGMILVHDLEKFLSLDEETALDRAVNDARHG